MAIRALTGRGRQLYIVSQSLYEFWATATRPIFSNGSGFSIAECAAAIGGIERLFPLLPDQPTVLAEWKSLLLAYQCQGKVSHDARLVAAMPHAWSD